MQAHKSLIYCCFVALASVATTRLFGQSPGSGQDFPSKPIRIVASDAGGAGDLAARVIAQGLTASLGQPVIVDNRGGSGVVAAEYVAKAPPDGHTLLFYGSTIWVLPLLQAGLPYDPVRDYAPVTIVASAPNILVVYPQLPVKTVRDLIALAKARPGELNYSSGITGAATHLAAELFKSMARVNIVRVSYKGDAPAINDLLGGQVQLTFGTVSSVGQHLKSGRLRGLAVTSSQPSALMPALPTVAASGLPGYESGSIYGMYAPVKTPATIINRLNQEVARYVKTSEIRERFFNAGTETVGSTPDQLSATMKSEMTRLGKVIKEAGIRAE